ncbi:MAG: YfhO family protein, partial [Thermoanaerobaculia bacterium]
RTAPPPPPRGVITSAVVVLLLAAAAAALRGVSRWLGRPVPAGTLALFAALSVLPFAKALLPGRTILPLEHATLTAPWLTLGTGPPRNPWLNDVGMQMLPWNEAVRLALAEGSLPLRDRWNGAGTPLAANGQSAAFSPLTLLTLPLPIPAAFLLQAALKLLLAFAGMWLWTRELSASRGAAVFAAIAFAFSMTFSQWILFPHTAVYCLWPWMLFLIERTRDAAGRGRAVAALIVTLSCAALSGHPETLALGVLFAVLWVLLRWAMRDLPDALRVGRSLLGAGLAAAGLAAFLLLPTALAIRASNRMVIAAQPHWSGFFSLVPHGARWRAVATAFYPRSLGDLIHMPQLAGVTGAFPEMALGYFGLVGWAAALLVLRPGSPRPRASWALLALLLCGMGVAVALWPFAEIFGAIPAVRHMFPLRFYSWIALAGPALAALELDRYARDRARGPRPAWGAVAIPLLLLGAGLLWFLHLRPELTAEGALGFQKRQLAIAAGLLVSAAGLALLAGARSGVYVAGLSALCAADLLYQWRSHYRVFPTALLYPETPLIRHLRSLPAPFRTAGAGTALFPNTNVFARVEDVRTHDPVERRDYVAFLDATAGFTPGDYFKKLRDLDSPALDFLNVRALVVEKGGAPPAAPVSRWRRTYSGTDGDVYENASVLPRAFVPARVRLVAGSSKDAEPLVDANAAFGPAFADIAANRDYREMAWILSDRAGEEPGGDASISKYAETTNTVELDVAAAAPSWVVLSIVQDGGWSARDAAGRALPLSRANGPFLALKVPAGSTQVRMRYRPPGFVAGAWISGITLVILVAVWLRRRTATHPAGGTRA